MWILVDFKSELVIKYDNSFEDHQLECHELKGLEGPGAGTQGNCGLETCHMVDWAFKASYRSDSNLVYVCLFQ